MSSISTRVETYEWHANPMVYYGAEEALGQLSSGQLLVVTMQPLLKGQRMKRLVVQQLVVQQLVVQQMVNLSLENPVDPS